MKRTRGFSAACFLALAAAASSQAPPPPKPPALTPAEEAATREFRMRVDAYVKLTHDAAAGLPASKPIDQPAIIEAQRQERARRLVRLRAGAQSGDVMPPPIADMLRGRVRLAFAGPEGHAIRISLDRAEPADRFTLHVGATFPDASVPLQSVPASLLLYLPQLPDPLEFRLVGDNLVLRDRESNQVVDWIPHALPPA